MDAAGYGHLRAAQADRERAADVLKAAFAEGRLDRDEFAERVELAYRARTYADLAELTDDLPAGPLGALPRPSPSQIAPYPYPYPYSPPAIPYAKPPASGAAVAALALAIISPFTLGITAIPALVMGFWAVAVITRGRRTGMFCALLGLLFGAAGTGLFISNVFG